MMKRQLIQSAAAFLLRSSSSVETYLQRPILSHKCLSATDGIFSPLVLYLPHCLREGGMEMLVVVLMVMVVDMLLLYATCRLLSSRACLWRYIVAVFISGGFACLSLAANFPFLGSFYWQICFNLLTGLAAFGFSKETVRNLILFVLLRLSVGGVTGRDTALSMLLGAAGIVFACFAIGRSRRFMPVELNYGGKTYHITALCDTGHSLRDPVTGKNVLVVDAKISRCLTGLEPLALKDPVSSILTVPGLRLIPYQSVGNTGFLLALPIPNAKIGNRQTSILVALSPNLLSRHYQALTGGSL